MTPPRFPLTHIAKASYLRRHLAKGEGLSLLDFENGAKYRSLRHMALMHDAPASVHRVLDDLGEPFESAAECSKLAVTVINRSHAHSLAELHREQPQTMESAMREGRALGALLVLHRHLEHPSMATGKMLELATLWGADWQAHRQAFQTVALAKKRDRFEELVRNMTAFKLEADWPAAQAVASPRPRL